MSRLSHARRCWTNGSAFEDTTNKVAETLLRVSGFGTPARGFAIVVGLLAGVAVGVPAKLAMFAWHTVEPTSWRKEPRRIRHLKTPTP